MMKILTILIMVFLVSCAGDPVTDSGCSSVDECLAQYDFEGARKFIDEDYGFNEGEKKKNITIAESKYWADKGDIDRALSVLDESWGIDESDWPESDWQAWKFNIIDKGVIVYCEQGNYSKAKIIALKASTDLNSDGLRIGKTPEGIVIEGPSMRDILNKKIEEFEKITKK